MGVREQKESENKKAIEALPEKIEGVEMQTPNGPITVDLIKTTRVNKSGSEKNIITVDHEEFPADQQTIRMYLPLYGAAGYVPDEEDLRNLFAGKSIKPKRPLISKGDKPYTPAEITFDPFKPKKSEDGKRIFYYGDSEMKFANQK